MKIETGRYARPYIPRHARLCTICNLVEDEYHVVFICPVYSDIRIKYLRLLSANNTIKKILNAKRDFIIDTANLLLDIEHIRSEMGK